MCPYVLLDRESLRFWSLMGQGLWEAGCTLPPNFFSEHPHPVGFLSSYLPICLSVCLRARTISGNFDFLDRFGLTEKVLGWTSLIEMDRNIWLFRPIPNPNTSLLGNFHVEHGGTHFVNSVSFGVTRTSMCSYTRSFVASQAKCMLWLLKALENDLFPGRIWNVLFVIRTWCLSSYGKYLGRVT